MKFYKIRHLKLSYFRNYKDFLLDIDNDFIVMHGKNGIGKTNILEAISILYPGRGLRAAKGCDMRCNIIPDIHNNYGVFAKVWGGKEESHIGVGYEFKNGKSNKTIKIDGDICKSQKELSNYVNVLWFTPQINHAFIFNKSDRRKFVDRLIYGLDRQYLDHINSYEKAMSERNNLLKNDVRNDTWLNSLELIISQHCISISRARIAFLEKFKFIQDSDLDDELISGYNINILCKTCDMIVGPESEEMENLQKYLRNNRRFGAKNNFFDIGAHCADYEIILNKKQMSYNFCSVGEQKLLVFFIILITCKIYREFKSEHPILLLDDIFSSLDECNIALVIKSLINAKCQSWITHTNRKSCDEILNNAYFINLDDLSAQ